MLKVIALAAQAALALHVLYWATTALWGWRNPVPAPPGSGRRRFRIVVPAHNEAAVIDGLLTDLAGQRYPGELVDTVVVADRCSDDTARIAGRAATVVERNEGPTGKGPVLAWYLDRSPLHPDEALVVLDADNRVPPDLLASFSDELDAGGQVLQAYLDVGNPDASALATAAALSYWASNRMIQLSRRNLGWSADLGGTGMCLTATALGSVGGFGDAAAEDQEIGVRLALAGAPTIWLHYVRIYDEKPTQVGVAVRQRARWAGGRRQVARRHLTALLRAAGRRRSWGLVDLALRLVQPGRMFVALLSAVLAVVAAATGSDWLFPWQMWTALALLQVLAPLPFLARDGVAGRYLLRYPYLVILAALWIPVRIVARLFGGGWYHTPHRGR